MHLCFPSSRFARVLSTGFLTLVFLLCGSIANAQASPSDESGDGLATVQIDIGRFMKSEIGDTLVQAAAGLMAEELGKDSEEALKAVKESIGFDPIEQELRAYITISNLDEPLKGMKLQAEFKNSTGNLEGLLLAAPKYGSMKHEGTTVHSVAVDDETSVFVAFPSAKSGKKRVIASNSKDAVTQTIDEGSTGELGWAVPEGQFLSIKLGAMPEEINEVPPLAALSSLLDHVAISIGEVEESLSIQLELHASEEEKAAQLQQLAQGAVAMVSLFSEPIREELDDDETATSVLNAAEQMVVDREGTTVRVKLDLPMSIIMQFLKEEAGLPL